MQEQALDSILSALADPTRRRFVERLATGPRSISELARDEPISLPAVSRHIKVLERAGLISREKRGRTHFCSLRMEPFDDIEAFVSRTRSYWTSQLDRLAAFVEDSDE